MFRCASIILVAILAAGCTRIKPEAPARTTVDSALTVPLSELNVPVFFPIAELEKIANSKLTAKVFEAKVPLSKNNDTLDLAITRFEPVKLAYNGKRGITYVLPMRVDGHLRSRVAGIRVQNKKPVTARVIITLYSDLYLDRDWNLAPQTKLMNLEWVEEPRVNVAGIKVNLRGPLERALLQNESKITDKLDATIKESAKIRQSIEKLWHDIQKPIRINRQVVPVWLKADAEDMNARLIFHSKDTLVIEVGLKTRIQTILDSANNPPGKKGLPGFRIKPDNSPGMVAYVKATVPFSKLNEVLRQVTDTMRLRVNGREIRVKEVEVYGTTGGVAIRLLLRGDLRAEVYLRGKVGFDTTEHRVVIDDFGFDMNSDQALLAAADWLTHDVIIDRLQPYLSLPMRHTFDALPALITKGIERGKLGSKIDLFIPQWTVGVEHTLITRTDIQLIVVARGLAAVQLEKALFSKQTMTRSKRTN